MELTWITHNWTLLVAAAFLIAIWFFRRKVRQEERKFAAEHGFQFQDRIDPAELNLYETSFFGRFDTATDVTSGTIDGAGFVHFVQGIASGHGHKASSRDVVAFDAVSGSPDSEPTSCGNGFTMEVSHGRVFMWQEEDPEDDLGLEGFLHLAIETYRTAAAVQ